jgi:hypothetical protein
VLEQGRLPPEHPDATIGRVLAANPWQAEDAKSAAKARCGMHSVELPAEGRHTGIFVVQDDRVTTM